MGLPFDGADRRRRPSAPARLHGIGDLERDTVQGAGAARPCPAAAQPALLPLTIIEIYS